MESFTPLVTGVGHGIVNFWRTALDEEGPSLRGGVAIRSAEAHLRPRRVKARPVHSLPEGSHGVSPSSRVGGVRLTLGYRSPGYRSDIATNCRFYDFTAFLSCLRVWEA